MEHRSRAGQPLSASAQRILAALRAQHADRGALRRQRSVPSAGETGGAVLRRIQEEGSWSRTQQGSTTGDQRGAGRSWSRGHLGDHLQVEGIRDRPSPPPYAHIPELSWNRSGGRAPAVGVPLSPQGPPEDEGGIRGNGAGPERESGARQLLLQSDIINMGGAQASGHGEREGPCRVAGREEPVLGALNHPVCQAGPQGGRRQFGRLLLPPWNRVSKEGEQAGRGKEGAESEKGLAEALGDGQIRSFGGGSWPAREAAFRLPGDSVTQGGDWVGWGRGEMLRFGRSLQRDGVVEDAEERRCRNGALLGMQPAVQGGFQVTSPSGWEAAPTEIECFRNPAWSDTGAGDQLAMYREEDSLSPFRHTVLQEDHLVCYREEQVEDYRVEQAEGYREEQPRAYGEEQPGGYREEQARGYREKQPRAYGEEQPGGYREEQAGGYREEHAGGYGAEQAGGCREEQAGGYREEHAGGYGAEQAGGCREEQAGGCREEQAGGYREEHAGGYRAEPAGGTREEQPGGSREEQAGGYRAEQAGGCREEQPGGSREEQAGGYRAEQAGGYREDQAGGCREEQPGGCREDQAGGCREEQAGGCREEQAGGCREEQAGGYRDSERDPHSEYQDNREHTGSAAVCPSLTEGQMETSNQDRPNDTASQVNGTDHGDSSEAAGVGSGRLESGVDLALESSCPIKEIPANSECTPPAPSTTGPSCPDHSQPLPRRGNSQGTANRVVPLKRRRASPPPKSSGAKRPGRWEPPRPSQERRSRGVTQTPTPPAPSPAPEAGGEGLNTHGVTSESHSPPGPQAPPELPKPLKEKRAGRGGRGQETHRREEGQEPSWAPTSDPAVRDASRFSREERAQALQEVARAPALVLTMVYQDGSTQLCPKQKSLPSACGVLVLLKRSLDVTGPEETPGPGDSLVFLRLEQRPAWAQQDLDRDQDLFTREVVQRVVSAGQVVVCYKAKDLLRSLLQHFRGDLGWKQVAQCRILDPQIAAWLLDPADSASCFQDLVTKHCRRPAKHPLQPPASGKASNLGISLSLLYQLMMELRSNLQAQGLWELFSSMELSMIPVLAAMESHRIHVDKEALKRTSEMLGAKLKQLEQEAHKAAGQQFLVSSSAQLRLVLFEKLRLQDRCENRKLPKTVLKQQQSTSEAVLLQLQDLHPLPRIILEYRQVHKIKSTFVDGILSCMKKTYVSSTWNQTSAVSGRLSAKQPNFQALPRQPVQISKKQYIPGKQAEVVTVHPRDMFIPQEGRTFLAADFCQVELRLLAHLTSDPELLRLFQDPDADVFSMLASQWKGVPEDRLNPEDREHAKRIVYSVVYGAGRERLSGILGVSAEQASRFVDSFLQRYREVQNFIQRTIQQCQKQGYVVSIMGRRRSLPNIHSADWAVRNQAERQAVNFVVQGSAADLCKMAMIRIFSLVSSSSSLTPSGAGSSKSLKPQPKCSKWTIKEPPGVAVTQITRLASLVTLSSSLWTPGCWPRFTMSYSLRWKTPRWRTLQLWFRPPWSRCSTLTRLEFISRSL
ncbi:DNA polymerase nu isoform X2 [Anguilla anguilla]|uniref:DNA polymerase nu isoform X2 n=1 Tax=Anguilla anguilla TaxID=7936 RepID=UPI0015A7F030|nr:DNA polymerase nu isoform X2 [Anguilla anguilla]